jgi:hypothetical protein
MRQHRLEILALHRLREGVDMGEVHNDVPWLD